MSKVYFKGCTFWATIIDKEANLSKCVTYFVSEAYTQPDAFSEWLRILSQSEDGCIINCGVIPPYVTEEEEK